MSDPSSDPFAGYRVLQPADGVRLVKNVRALMRDGVRLATDLYLGADGGTVPQPVVIDYIPYRKDEVNPTYARMYLELARAGYVAMRVDIRGTGASEGHAVDEYVAQEQADGYDLIEWVAAQPWCDGHVNLMGASYGGFTALQIATTQPPHLTSIIPVYFTDDRYTDDCHYRGGLLRMYYDLGWYGVRMIAWNAMPPDPASAGPDWARTWEQHLAEDEPYVLSWLRHQVDGPYWRQGSVAGQVDRITCPTFLIGGWADGYPNPPLRLYQALRGAKKVLIGPWNHSWPDSAIPGPRIDHLHEVIRWLDHWCRGRDTGIMAEPPITVWIGEAGDVGPDRLDAAGSWRSETAWPPEGAGELVLHLGAGGHLAPDGPDADGVDAYVYDPSVGVTAGLWSGGVPFGLSSDQRPDEARSLVYTTEPLAESLTVLGRAVAELHVASTATVMGFAASLSDVAPDGTSQLIAKGMLNGTRRRSLTDPRLLGPGAVTPIAVEIDATGWRVQAGHRLRLSIASADFPNVWPTPEAGVNQVSHGPTQPSRLVLPTVPDGGGVASPAYRPSPVTIRPPSAQLPAATWVVSRDRLTDRAMLDLQHRAEFLSADGSHVVRDSGCHCEVDPADPARAVARGWHVNRAERPGWVVESRAEAVVESTATDLHVVIDLVVMVNEATHHTRRWVETIPRALL